MTKTEPFRAEEFILDADEARLYLEFAIEDGYPEIIREAKRILEKFTHPDSSADGDAIEPRYDWSEGERVLTSAECDAIQPRIGRD